ncbi:MAG: type II secretion system F family protein [Acidobacteriales bacterium]|nr:MAG: type II secretion system F family protein [Terriglobales bacterium]
MAVLISVIFFGMLLGVITLFGYRRYARPGRVYDQLGATASSAGGVGLIEVAGPKQESIFVRITQQIGEKVPISPQDVSSARRYLVAAGFKSEGAIRVYYGIKVVLCLVLLVLALIFRDSITSNPVLRIVLVVAAGLVGYLGPGFYLESLVSARQERIRLSLPDALDLMVVSVEAGLGLDQAIRSVSEQLKNAHKEICEELGLVTLEMRAGKRRSDALKNLADRTGEVELRKLVAILIQADRFGTSIADSLRTHSDFMRVRRRQDAEERAAKVGVKLVFPIFFFILPSMLVVAAGPGLLQIFKNLFPLMRNFGK